MKRMRRTRNTARRRLGVLTFEWILLISLLVIGIIGGLSAVRNALICELTDLAECITALNVCGCGECDESGCPPGQSDCCDDPWWCWSCDNPSCGLFVGFHGRVGRACHWGSSRSRPG